MANIKRFKELKNALYKARKERDYVRADRISRVLNVITRQVKEAKDVRRENR